MYVWIGLWLAVVFAEAGLYAIAASRLMKTTALRAVLSGLILVATVATNVMLLVTVKELWVASAFLTVYRVINLFRLMSFRHHPAKLGSLGLQAHRWLVAAQLLFFGVSWAFSKLPLYTALGLVACMQLLAVLALLRVSIRTWQFAEPKVLEKHFPDSRLPTVSVLIPARDETTALQSCLQSIIQSDYPKLEILVLDDCSVGKQTPQIIRSFAQEGVRFLAGKMPPESWVAKNYGYEQLQSAASGEVLLFCGVDATFEPKTIRAVVENLLTREKDMLSVLPTRPDHTPSAALFQSMRYYWELCLPRRFFKRPPVLSTCWLIRAKTLKSLGGFAGVAQSVSPEAHFARKTVISNSYTFIRCEGDLQVHTHKNTEEQYETTVRLRYPQLHRRLELVAGASLMEGSLFIAPFLGLLMSFWFTPTLAFFALWLACVVVVESIYYLIAVETGLHAPWYAILTAPLAFAIDVVMLHVSMLQYEFGSVNWKGRNLCVPVLQVEPRLPKI